MAIRCPRCGSYDIRRRRARGVLRGLGAVVFLRPFRCEICKRRFTAFRLWSGASLWARANTRD